MVCSTAAPAASTINDNATCATTSAFCRRARRGGRPAVRPPESHVCATHHRRRETKQHDRNQAHRGRRRQYREIRRQRHARQPKTRDEPLRRPVPRAGAPPCRRRQRGPAPRRGARARCPSVRRRERGASRPHVRGRRHARAAATQGSSRRRAGRCPAPRTARASAAAQSTALDPEPARPGRGRRRFPRARYFSAARAGTSRRVPLRV